MSESHQREAALFDAAMDLPPEQRAAYLEQACAGDAALRRRLEALLKAGESHCEFLDSPLDAELGQTLPITVPPSEKPGDRIGRYKLLEQIGEGGCGVVYVADQTEPVRRRVALKIIKLGMDTKSVIARFEAERQALALMDHPNIAKVFDAGATETGRPYFVMELVRGIKITDYCDEKKLPTRERLDLFIQVCQAIQHAHQKGIIHRDIKPSNILVTVNDGVAVPKIIDFGIAKATSGQLLTDKTVYTAFEQFIGTPAYMSPEQAVLTSLDIDTRSDIYALGVLLFELLTSKTPFDPKELLEIGLDEMRRTIRETEPPRPSTRVSTLPGQELSTTAQRRGLEPPKLVSELRGDLDWIVMKCLEKDRARRYETANGLAMDIQRHLDNEPVVACPPSRLYRFQKLVRRNKLTFVAAGAVAASLVVGLTLSTVLFFRERAARQRANEQAAIAEAVNEFLQQDLLRQAHSLSQVKQGFTPDPDLTVRQALKRAADRIGDRFKDQPLQEAAVRETIGSALRGVGEFEPSIQHLQRAYEVRRAKLGPDDPKTLSSMDGLARSYLESGKWQQALPLFEEALKRRKASQGPDHIDTLSGMGSLARVYDAAGKPDQALLLGEETLKLAKAKLGPDHIDTLGCMCNVASGYASAGKLDQAVLLYEEVLKLMKAKQLLGHYFVPVVIGNLASAYQTLGKLEQAVSLFEEAVRLSKASQGPDHPKTLACMNGLGWAYAAAGKLDQAQALLEETLKLAKARLGPNHPLTLGAQVNLALAYREAGKLEQALPLLEETLKLNQAKLGPNHPATLKDMGNLALAYQDAGKLEQALALIEETLKGMRATLGANHLDTLQAQGNLAHACRAAGKLEQALALFEETLELQKANLGPEHPATLGTMEALAYLHECQGKFAEADALSRERLAAIRRRDGPESVTYGEALAEVGSTFLLRHQWAQAEPLLREGLGLQEKRQPDDWHTFRTRSALGRALLGQGKLAEAEPLIVTGYNGLKERKAAILKASFEDELNGAMDGLVLLTELRPDQPQAAQWKAEIERVRRVSDAGAIRRWLILDPMALGPGQSVIQGLEMEQVGPEAQLRPRAGDTVSVGGVERVWRERTLRDYAIDFNGLQGEVTPRSVAYAVCYMRSATAQKELVLKIGSDDQARVYLNGQKMYEQKKPRGLKLDEDTVSDVELRAGLNVVVFKVVNGDGGWRGSLRFATRDDQPVPGIEVTLDPGDTARP